MAVNVIMPNLGKTMKEGLVAKWAYDEGDKVEKDAEIAVVETEKITFQVEAPISGILVKILVPAGTKATVDEILGVMAEEGEPWNEADVPPSDAGKQKHDEKKDADKGESREKKKAVISAADNRIKISPLAKRIANEKGIDISAIKGSGPGGRITKDDVLSFVKAKPEKPKVKVPVTGFGAKIPLTTMREIIADRLTASSRDVPHIYLACEVDGTGMIEFRKTFLDIVESKHGVRLSFNDIILMAVARAIEKYPLINASYEGKEISIHDKINIGLAVAVEDGLIVPVIKKVNEMTIGKLAAARKEIMDKASRKKITLDDLSGGTFTVSNLGQFDIDFFISIINPPEAGILSVAKMKERPVVVDGTIAIRPTVNIGLSLDHRVVDGALGSAFLQDLKQMLENPYSTVV